MKPSIHKFIPDKKLSLNKTIEEKIKSAKRSNTLYLNNLFIKTIPDQVRKKKA